MASIDRGWRGVGVAVGVAVAVGVIVGVDVGRGVGVGVDVGGPSRRSRIPGATRAPGAGPAPLDEHAAMSPVATATKVAAIRARCTPWDRLALTFME